MLSIHSRLLSLTGLLLLAASLPAFPAAPRQAPHELRRHGRGQRRQRRGLRHRQGRPSGAGPEEGRLLPLGGRQEGRGGQLRGGRRPPLRARPGGTASRRPGPDRPRRGAPPPADPNSVLSLVVFVDNVHIRPRAPHAGRGADPPVPGAERPRRRPGDARHPRRQPARPPPLHRRRRPDRRRAARGREPPELRPAGGAGTADGVRHDGGAVPDRQRLQPGRRQAGGGVRPADAGRRPAHGRRPAADGQLAVRRPRPQGRPLRQRRRAGHPRRGALSRRPTTSAPARWRRLGYKLPQGKSGPAGDSSRWTPPRSPSTRRSTASPRRSRTSPRRPAPTE